MRLFNVIQGSPDWHKLRCGIPTASCFDKILTAKRLDLATGRHAYRFRLLAEAATGEAIEDEYVTSLMERGSIMEGEAARWYEFETGLATQLVGFIKHDTLEVGGSPDRLVGDDGGLEIKCPSSPVHLRYLVDGPDDAYRLQVQGNLWLSERAWWDFVSYHPDLPNVRKRFERDAEVIKTLDQAVRTFIGELDSAKEALRALGQRVYEPWEPPANADPAAAGASDRDEPRGGKNSFERIKDIF